MLIMKKEPKILKKQIQYAVKKYTKAEDSMITQEKKIKDLINNIKKMRYIIEGYCSIIEHNKVDKNNNNLKLMQSMKLLNSEVFKDNKEVQID